MLQRTVLLAVFIILASGCIREPAAEPATTTTSSTTSSSSTTITTTSTSSTFTTSSTTTSTIFQIVECENIGMRVDDWKARCYDDHAIMEGDPNHCISVHCLAKVTKNRSVCPIDDQACLALAAGDSSLCNEVYHKSECKKTVAMVLNDIKLCEKGLGDKRKIECWRAWAQDRGNTSYCEKADKSRDILECTSWYFSRIGQEKLDKGWCDKVQHSYARSLCLERVNEAIIGGYSGNLMRLLDPSRRSSGASNFDTPGS